MMLRKQPRPMFCRERHFTPRSSVDGIWCPVVRRLWILHISILDAVGGFSYWRIRFFSGSFFFFFFLFFFFCRHTDFFIALLSVFGTFRCGLVRSVSCLVRVEVRECCRLLVVDCELESRHDGIAAFRDCASISQNGLRLDITRMGEKASILRMGVAVLSW